MKTILGWVQSNVCSLDWALMEYMELVETESDVDERKRLMAVLTAEGKCKYDHVCDQWVTDKGPKGRCLSAKHKRGECDNPNKCDQAAQ